MRETPADYARRTVAEHAALTLAAPQGLRLRRLEAFIKACSSDIIVDSATKSLQEEHTSFLRSYAKNEVDACRRLQDIVSRIGDLRPSCWAFAKDQFGKSLKRYKVPEQEPLEPTNLSGLPVLAGKILDATVSVAHFQGMDPSPVKQLEDEIAALRHDALWRRDRLELHRLTHAGSAYSQLERIVASNSPDARTGTDEFLFFKWHKIANFGDSMHEPERSDAKALNTRLTELVKTLDHGLRGRIGLRGGHRVALERYAWGAVSFRRNVLRALADSSKKPEERLTEDAAAHLFHHGFKVFTEVSLGNTRLDLVSLSDGLLVEAKQYSSKSPSAVRGAIRGAVRQVLAYHNRIRSELVSVDAYILLFRRDGPLVSLPCDPVLIGTTAINFVFVDLGDQSGSKAPATVEVTMDDVSSWGKADSTDDASNEPCDVPRA